MSRFILLSLVLAFYLASMLGCSQGEPAHTKIKGSHFKRLEAGNNVGKPAGTLRP